MAIITTTKLKQPAEIIQEISKYISECSCEIAFSHIRVLLIEEGFIEKEIIEKYKALSTRKPKC